MSEVRSMYRGLRELLAGRRGWSLVTVSFGWGLLAGTRMIYPVLLPHFRTVFDLNLTVAGLLLTIVWLGSALGQLPGGVLADRRSERTVMIASMSVVAVALVLVVTAPSLVVLFGATGLVGLGLSLYPIARMTYLSDLYPDRIGGALGVTMAFADVGQTVLPPIAGVLTLAIAWQLGLGFTIPFFVLIAILLWAVLPVSDSPESAIEEFSLDTARYVFSQLRTPPVGTVTIILFCYLCIWQSFSGFYPTYLVDVKGFSTSVAGGIFALFFALGVVVKPLAGAAYDRIGVRTSLLIVLGVPIAGLALLPFVSGFWPIVGLTALVSGMLGAGPISQSYLIDVLPEDMRGTGLGALRSSVLSLGSMSPVLFGAAADRGYFDEGFLALAVLAAGVMVLTLRLPRR